MGNNQSYDLSRSLVTERQTCYSCGLQSHPSVATCPFHSLCMNCQVQSVQKKFSVCCLETLLPEKLQLLQSELGLCMVCSKSVQGGKSKLCLCILCEGCFGASISQEEFCKICTKRKNKSGFVTCGICYKYHPKETTISHNRCSYFCKPCLLQSFLNSLPSQKEFNLNCPSCENPYDDQIIHKLIPNDLYNHLSFEFVRIRSESEWCFNCKSFTLAINPRGTVQPCKKCLGVFCKNCSKDLNNCKCDFDFESVAILLIYEKLFFTRCPSCSRPYIKDGDCSSVNCLNSKCKEKFCAECQTLLYTPDSNGKFFHKSFCKFYRN